MRLAIADDQSPVRSALRLVLEQEAEVSSVDEAADAAELLRQVASEQMDVLLLDWELPGMATDQLMRLIRSEQPGLRIVAMSSRSEAKLEALAAGADGFVGKEYSTRLARDELRDAIAICHRLSDSPRQED